MVPSTHYAYATARVLLDEVKRTPFKWVSRKAAYGLLANAAAFAVDHVSDEEGRHNGKIVILRNTDLVSLDIDYEGYTRTARELKERKLKV